MHPDFVDRIAHVLFVQPNHKVRDVAGCIEAVADVEKRPFEPLMAFGFMAIFRAIAFSGSRARRRAFNSATIAGPPS